MKVNIQRTMYNNKFVYNIKGYTFVGESNCTYGLFPIQIKIPFEESCIELKQSIILKLINCLPVLNMETLASFKAYLNKKYIGKSTHKLFEPVFYFDFQGGMYEVRLHNNNYISLMKNNIQTALYNRVSYSEGENNIYEVEFDDSKEHLVYILLFCIFIDRVFYSNNGKVNYLKWEKNIVINDRHKVRTSWKLNK